MKMFTFSLPKLPFFKLVIFIYEALRNVAPWNTYITVTQGESTQQTKWQDSADSTVLNIEWKEINQEFIIYILFVCFHSYLIFKTTFVNLGMKWINNNSKSAIFNNKIPRSYSLVCLFPPPYNCFFQQQYNNEAIKTQKDLQIHERKPSFKTDKNHSPIMNADLT